MMDSARIRRLCARLAQPYEIPADCPYLSDEQRELSRLPWEKRAEWMAEWLRMAQGTADDDRDYEWIE